MYDILNVYLENGLQVIMHRVPYVRTMACGLWVKQGSKHESAVNNGISHLLEHMMLNIENHFNPKFQRLIGEISSEGVVYNASTTKESTAYYFTGLSNTTEKCLEALSAIVKDNKTFPEDLFENEKKVVLQEATSYYSSFNQIKERTTQALWGCHGVGNIIVGSLNVVKEATLKDLEKLIEETYTPENAVLVVVGGVEYEKILEYVNKFFIDWKDRDTRGFSDSVDSEPGIYFNRTQSNNAVVSVGFRTGAYKDRDRMPLEIITKVIGDNSMESRLMQEIRMKRGLAYSVGGFNSFFETRGNLGFTAVCSNESVTEVTSVMMAIFEQIKKEGLTSEEVNRAKKILETQKLLELDNLSGQLKFLGKCAMSGQLFSLEQEVRNLKKIQMQAINEAISQVFVIEKMGFASIGNFDIDDCIPVLQLS